CCTLSFLAARYISNKPGLKRTRPTPVLANCWMSDEKGAKGPSKESRSTGQCFLFYYPIHEVFPLNAGECDDSRGANNSISDFTGYGVGIGIGFRVAIIYGGRYHILFARYRKGAC